MLRRPLHPRDMSRCFVVFADQLDPAALEDAGLRRDRDRVLIVECREDYLHVPSHRQRALLFISAQRHYAAELEDAGWSIRHRRLGESEPGEALQAVLRRELRALEPERVVAVRPGEWRQEDALRAAAGEVGLDLELREDRHFLCPEAVFEEWADGRSRWVMEHFYRMMRRRLELLLQDDGSPVGGSWNFDADNREALGEDGPDIPEPRRFEPDALTRAVRQEVDAVFPELPGSGEGFAWPVTRAQAEAALEDFVAHRLPHFGDYQDAMAQGRPWLFHSLLSPALNLKLLDPRDCLRAAVGAWESGHAPLNAVEGFVRQIIGWREFIRGVYRTQGPEYAASNALEQHGKLPELYWNAETDMACVADAVGQVLEHGYGHHIQRLMVTGNLGLLLGVHPRTVSDWYLGMYVDAVDWVTLPNALGMVMHADGGLVGTKPYISSGRYIQRMSDYCERCRFRPDHRVGESACPFSTLYWDFLDRHRGRLEQNMRMRLQVRNLDRIDEEELAEIRARARSLRERLGVGEIRSGQDGETHG